MRFVFVMDPLDRVTHDKDTTFAFIEAAQARGHESHHCLLRDLCIEDGDAWATTHPVADPPASRRTSCCAARRARAACASATSNAVFIRKDPPFDRAYLYATLVLEHARGKTLLINDPRGLRDANEKLYALNFPEWTPRTMVTADRDMIHRFCRDVGGVAMIKPLDGAGGMGVIQIKSGEKNARAIVDMLTAEGRHLAMVQEFLPSVTAGDKRVILLDGEPLGAILRVLDQEQQRQAVQAGGVQGFPEFALAGGPFAGADQGDLVALRMTLARGLGASRGLLELGPGGRRGADDVEAPVPPVRRHLAAARGGVGGGTHGLLEHLERGDPSARQRARSR